MLGGCSYQLELQGLFEDVLHTVKLLNVQFTLVDFQFAAHFLSITDVFAAETKSEYILI